MSVVNVYFPKNVTLHSASAAPAASTNPDYPAFRHAVTLSVGAKQIQRFIRMPRRLITRASPPGPRSNIDDAAFERTLTYLCTEMRSGIYVLIKRGRVAMFAPFVNPEYRNKFSIRLRPALPAPSDAAGTGGGGGVVLRDASRWWANANILCNIEPPDLVSDHGWLMHLRFLCLVCAIRDVPDCEFFLNKRDSPMVRRDGRHVFHGLMSPDLAAAPVVPTGSQPMLLPVLSPYGGAAYADRLWPLQQDFAYLDPPATPVRWESRAPVAVFRGTSTGALVDNARMALCRLSATEPELLDARLTGMNNRDRLTAGGHVVRQTRDPALPCSRAFFMTMAQQAAGFRYAVYIQGHVAASRYMSLMVNGFVILRVATSGGPDVADQLWFMPQLQPGVDHVPVKADMSDLLDRIRWLRAHDAEARAIAARAHALGHHLLHAQVDYAAETLRALHTHT
jgi:hypothetical protein